MGSWACWRSVARAVPQVVKATEEDEMDRFERIEGEREREVSSAAEQRGNHKQVSREVTRMTGRYGAGGGGVM